MSVSENVVRTTQRPQGSRIPPAASYRARHILTPILLLLVLTTFAAELPPKFISAIHQVETGGRLGAIVGDNGRSLGPLQISRKYWEDSGVAGTYKNVTNLAYATRVVTAYLRRHAAAALATGDVERLARVHNGGPQAHRKKSTLGYWRRVQAAMGG
jgi:hypothetical protein